MSKSKRGWCRVMIVEQGEGVWGAQRYLLRLAPLLEARGVEQVLASQKRGALTAAWIDSGRPHVALEAPAARNIRSSAGRIAVRPTIREAARMVAIAIRTAALARQTRADVIHANSHWSHLEGVAASRIADTASLLLLHEESEPDWLGRARSAAVLAADATISVSEAVASTLSRRATARTLVVPNGIDAARFSPGIADPLIRTELTDDVTAPVVLSMSRLDPRKGVGDLIKAVAALPDSLAHTRLAIAGQPSIAPAHEAELRRLANALLPGRVRFLGQRNDGPQLMRAADVLGLASSLEGMPLGVLEAQACGLPVAAYPAAGVPEIITHRKTGMLARAGDPNDLASQIAAILRDDALRNEISGNARASVLASHTLERQADDHVAVLEALMRKRQA